MGHSDIWVYRLDPTFKVKWVGPRIIVPVECDLINVGSTPGLDVGSSPHFSMIACPLDENKEDQIGGHHPKRFHRSKLHFILQL